ncbi:hypothetical protein ACFPRL_36170 [Pseudoclavibacter helvolus]|uniref:Uncharacterized protein n=1 Tax=Pseudoclavibacter helvolus TaxID=255205 RepID=A0A7W4US32_9MICO|nr:hypothetical protein [Pseudoclavibacter helvolus]MBB2959634.1 hypothetical protein [Pseudoclavibacter helvolus]
MNFRTRLVTSTLVTVSLVALATGCTDATTSGEATSSPQAAETTGTPSAPASPTVDPVAQEEVTPEVGSPEAINVCSDALYYFYLDGMFNGRFNLDNVRVEGTRYVFENQSANYDYFPGYPYTDPDVVPYVDSLIADDNADIWCEQNGDTFNVGFVGGTSQTGVTMSDLKAQFEAADYEIRKLEGLV